MDAQRTLSLVKLLLIVGLIVASRFDDKNSLEYLRVGVLIVALSVYLREVRKE